MAFDFINTPTNGQIVTGPNGIQYQWDGTKWVAVTAPNIYAPLANPTFTGTVTIPAGAAIAGYAPLASPTFTGNPSLPTGTTAVTQPAGNSSTAPATTAFVQAAVAPAFNDTGRSYIHNGLFNVAQRGTSAFNIAPGSSIYTVDRWWAWAGATGDTFTLTPITLTDTDRSQIGDEAAVNAVQLTFVGGTGVSNIIDLGQTIENIYRLSNKTITLSFWAKATSGTPRIGLGYSQIIGGGAGTVGNIGVTPALTTTWQRYAVTQTIPSMAGKTVTTAGQGLEIDFILSCPPGSTTGYLPGSGGIGVQSGTIQLWGVQLEIGTAATPLAKLDPRQDLANCQRFYETGYANCSASATAAGGWSDMPVGFNVRKRAMPTMAMTLISNTNSQAQSTWVSAPYNQTQGFICEMQAITTGYFAMQITWTASAEL